MEEYKKKWEELNNKYKDTSEDGGIMEVFNNRVEELIEFLSINEICYKNNCIKLYNPVDVVNYFSESLYKHVQTLLNESITSEDAKRIIKQEVENWRRLFVSIISQSDTDHSSLAVAKCNGLASELDDNGFEELLKNIPCMMQCKIIGGKPCEVISDKNHNINDIKSCICNIESSSRNILGAFNKDSGRVKLATYLSVIANMSVHNTNMIKNTPIRLPDPSLQSGVVKTITDTEELRKQNNFVNHLKEIVKEAKKEGNNIPNLLLIPYSAGGHIVTLIVDKTKFDENGNTFGKNSIMCFDSSQYFTSKVGFTDIFHDTNKLNKVFFPKEIYDAFDNNKRCINKTDIQGQEGTCSFFTEAFIEVMSWHIINNPEMTLEDMKQIYEEKAKDTIIAVKEQKYNEFISLQQQGVVLNEQQAEHDVGNDQLLILQNSQLCNAFQGSFGNEVDSIGDGNLKIRNYTTLQKIKNEKSAPMDLN